MKSFVVFFFCLLLLLAAARPPKRSTAKSARRSARPLFRSRLYQQNFPTDYVTTTIQIGTPPQTFTVAVDTVVNVLWVYDVSDPNVPSGQHAYNSSASSTAQMAEGYFRALYTGPIDAYGLWRTDQATLFNQPAQLQSFGAASEVTNLDTFEEATLPFDGILGTGWLLDQEPGTHGASPIVNALQGLEKRQFTIWMNSTLSKPGKGLTQSKLTIGGNDADNCQLDNIFVDLYVPLSIYGDSQLTIVLQEFGFGDHVETPAAFASLQIDSPLMFFPPFTYREIYRQVQPDYDWSRELLTVDCSSISRIPPMGFTFNNVEFELGPQYFVVDIGLDNGKCAFAVGMSPIDDYRSPWVLGTPFNRKNCLTYDLDAETVLINLAVGQYD